jgi:CBS domain-containing protein
MLPNVPETVIDASSTLEQTVGRIMRETGLDRVPVVDR